MLAAQQRYQYETVDHVWTTNRCLRRLDLRDQLCSHPKVRAGTPPPRKMGSLGMALATIECLVGKPRASVQAL